MCSLEEKNSILCCLSVFHQVESFEAMGCKVCKQPQQEPFLLARKKSLLDLSGRRTFRSQYGLGELLGTGGFSTVRRCVNKFTGTQYAVKIVSRKDLDPESEGSFLQEARILQSLDCPYIVKCYEFFEEELFYYLVMEYVEGGELFSQISVKETHTEKEARGLILDLLMAVKYIHDKNIVHRDLKPENLLVSYQQNEPCLKLADFGFAAHTFGQDLTKDCGTLDYIAPEILQQQCYGKAVDMWSVGVITFILLYGYAPFFDSNDKTYMSNIKMCKYSFQEEYCDGVSEDAKDFIRNLLQLQPEKRYDVNTAINSTWMKQLDTKIRRRSLDAKALQQAQAPFLLPLQPPERATN